MQIEKIFQKSEFKVKVIIMAFLNSYERNLFYDVRVSILARNKRKWVDINFTDDYKYRCMDTENKKHFRMSEYLKYITLEEINQTALELWKSFKPNIIL